MHLYLTNRSHLNSAYVDDSGRVMYKVETPNRFFHRVATIKRVLPGDSHSSPEATGSSNRRSSDESDSESDEATNDNDSVKGDVEYDEVPDEHIDEQMAAEGGTWNVTECRFGDFAHLAEITFHAIAPSILRFGGQEHKSTQLFTRKRYGRNRAFNGPDGIEYQWILSRRASKLVRIDSDRTLIARFRRPRRTTRRPASLEIFSEGMHMVDLIVITFVYTAPLKGSR